MSNDKISSFHYLAGAAFTRNLKRLTRCKDFLELSKLVDIPKSTFSTWNSRNRTSHELIVRLHLALGIPVRELALSDDVRESSLHDSHWKQSPQKQYTQKQYTQKQWPDTPRIRAQAETYRIVPDRDALPQHTVAMLKSFYLHHGELRETGTVPYASCRLAHFKLIPASTIEVETQEGLFLVDQTTLDAITGRYLIDIDGRIGIYHLQRLPGRQINLDCFATQLTFSDDTINILGRIAVTIHQATSV
jgi:hypothetical protein